MAKQIKAMTSTLYFTNEFIEVFCVKTILVINESILLSKITMAFNYARYGFWIVLNI